MLDINRLMNGLAAERPVFHSEADFQFALAWRIGQETGTKVRLEFPPPLTERMHLDLWLPALGVAIELKYPTSELDVEVGGESFALLEQGAQDEGRYYFLRDVARLERVVAELPRARRGVAVLLTNDSLYWRPPHQTTIDAAFRLHEGRRIPGGQAMSWSPGAKTGIGKPPIRLTRPYECRWRNYGPPVAEAAKTKARQFRYLALPVRR